MTTLWQSQLVNLPGLLFFLAAAADNQQLEFEPGRCPRTITIHLLSCLPSISFFRELTRDSSSTSDRLVCADLWTLYSAR
jgi:hypothetical protein